tara:strand:+ start:1143 stop:2537 length:1395 start_codon:yes stop_codon:yes gene_type:complete
MIQDDLSKFQTISQRLLKIEQEQPVANPVNAAELFKLLDLKLEKEGVDDEVLYKSLEELVMNTPRTATKLFFNQLFGGRKSKAILGDLLAVMLNNSMYTYKVAGPMVGVEKEIIRNIANLIGYGADADGTIAPGGSMSNFVAMVMARDAYQESIRFKGVQHKMTLYSSAESHYSISKNASLMGIGRDQVRKIATDKKGVMLTSDLERQINEDKATGFHPFMVNATAGTTVLGAFDAVEETSEVCKKHNLWLHVDGAYCGSVIFSSKFKHLVKGAEKADSYSLNAHKMLGTPVTCSIIVAKDKKYLNQSFSTDARYLYQTDGDDYNLGKTSIQCGRRNDALKFWTLWKSIGTNGLEKIVDHQFHLAKVARDYVQKHPDYTLFSFEDSISVCFNYKNIPADKLCTALYQNASLMVGYGSYEDKEFVRLVTVNSDNDEGEIHHFFKILEDFVAQHHDLLLASEAVKA